MNIASYSGLSRIKLFLALSRTPHGLLDICTPLLAALLWLGHPPDIRTVLLGITAAFAGYTGVYALNDIVDYRIDREKIRQAGNRENNGYLDAAFVRHPLARGYLSMPEAFIWAGVWMGVSFLAAYLLNPVCAFILVAGGIMEALYCLLLRITNFRALLSGIVKTLGGLAAVFAVDGSPEPDLLLLIFFWLFFWEIGGQNIPADWHDIQEDTVLRARTVPVTLGTRAASIIVLVTLIVTVILSGVLFRAAPLRLVFPLNVVVVLAGLYLLVIPAFRLYKTLERDSASSLFNRASWYPCILLLTSLAALVWRH